MHSSHEKNADDFWAGIQQQLTNTNLDFRGYVFPEEGDFNGAVFSDDTRFDGATFRGPAVFYGVTFKGEVNFVRVTFSDRADFRRAIFWRWAGFGGATFENHAMFEASFKGEANFAATRFNGYAGFDGTSFDGRGLWGAFFSGTTFSGVANFSKATFTKAYLERATFMKHADFSGATFAGAADFARATFAGTATFLGSTFSDEVVFSEVKFSDNTEFGRGDVGDLRFGKRTSFISANLEHVTFRSVDLSGCHFRDSRNLDKAEFDHVAWGRWPPQPLSSVRSLIHRQRLAVADEVWARSHVGPDDTDLPVPPFESVERVYRGLRASYEARKDYPRIGDFYFAEMEMRRLAVSPSRFRQRFGSVIAWYGLISGYGERWLQALACFAVVWVIAAILYLNLGLQVKVAQPGPSQLMDALIHSFLVATLIGRDVYAVPTTWLGQLVQAAEVLLGPLIVGLMGLAIRRRFQR